MLQFSLLIPEFCRDFYSQVFKFHSLQYEVPYFAVFWFSHLPYYLIYVQVKTKGPNESSYLWHSLVGLDLLFLCADLLVFHCSDAVAHFVVFWYSHLPYYYLIYNQVQTKGLNESSCLCLSLVGSDLLVLY